MKISAHNITIDINDTVAGSEHVELTIANTVTNAIAAQLTVHSDGSFTVQSRDTDAQDPVSDDDEDNPSEATEYIIGDLTDEENENLTATLAELADSGESMSVTVTEPIAQRMGQQDCSFTGTPVTSCGGEEVMFRVNELGLMFSLTDDDGLWVNPTYIHSVTIYP